MNQLLTLLNATVAVLGALMAVLAAFLTKKNSLKTLAEVLRVMRETFDMPIPEARKRTPGHDSNQGDAQTGRRLRLALLFLPPGDRDRYRQEWLAEIAGLPAGEAARFAASLLASAPRTGVALIFKKIWSRRAI